MFDTEDNIQGEDQTIDNDTTEEDDAHDHE